MRITFTPIVKEYGETGWQSAMAVHFATARMQPLGLMPKHQHIPKILADLSRKADPVIPIPQPVEPLTVAQHIEALVALSARDGFAKGRIMKLLRESGFRVDEPPTMKKKPFKRRRNAIK